MWNNVEPWRGVKIVVDRLSDESETFKEQRSDTGHVLCFSNVLHHPDACQASELYCLSPNHATNVLTLILAVSSASFNIAKDLSSYITMSDLDSSSSFLSASDPSLSQPSLVEHPSVHDDGEVDSLPSEADSDELTNSDDESESDADREWKESMQQLELILSMVILPYMGKYFGRKFAYWGASSTQRLDLFMEILTYY